MQSAQIEMKFGKQSFKVSIESESQINIKKIYKEFYRTRDINKYRCLAKPYRFMLLFTDFVIFLDSKVSTKATISIYENEEKYHLFYLLKRITWTKFNSKLRIRISHSKKIILADPLLLYMDKFVSRMLLFARSHEYQENRIIRVEYEIDSENLFKSDLTYAFLAQSEWQKSDDGGRPAEVERAELSLDVVMPTRNTPSLMLEMAINSVLNQLNPEDKFILVDDNDEPSELLLEKAQSNKNIVYVRGTVEGVAKARNIGIQSSTNSLVSFVDSDDYVSEDFIQVQRGLHERNPGIGATGFWLQSFGSSEFVYPQWDNLSVLSIVHCLPPAGVLMWKRKFLQGTLGGFDESFKKGFEDFDLVARASILNVPIVVLEESKYFYRRGHESLTQNWNASEEFTYTHKVISNIRKLNQGDLKLFLEIFERYGFTAARIPFDSFTKMVSRIKDQKLFWLVVSKFRNNSNIRQRWIKLPQNIKHQISWLVFFTAKKIDRFYESRFGFTIAILYKKLK